MLLRRTKHIEYAQGNVLAVYERRSYEDGSEELYLTEQHIYGSARLGMRKPDLLLAKSDEDVEIDLTMSSRALGEKRYELTNHLGNVLAVVSDKRLPNDEPDVISVSDYYPYGMIMSDRSYDAEEYRYGFGGHEKDDEISSIGNNLNLRKRNRDPRLGNGWWSMDPLTVKYPYLSPYQFVGNNPNLNIEVDGQYFISYSNNNGGSYTMHITNPFWVEKATKLSVIPYLGLIFEVSLWGAREQDPSFIATKADYVSLGLQVFGFASLKLIRKFASPDFLGESLLTINRECSSNMLTLFSKPELNEVKIDFLTAKSLEQEGIGRFYEFSDGKEMTSQFYFNNDFIQKIENEIKQDKKLTSKEDFNLQSEIKIRLSNIIENKKDEIKSLLTNNLTQED